MRGQCEGAVQLRMVAASGASSAHLANGGGYGIPFPHELMIGYNFEASVIVRCDWLSSVAKSALFSAHRQAPGRPS